jgi:hypothetical protein
MKPWRGPLSPTERVALVAALLVVTALCWPVRGYLTDDTFIHLQYAKNLARGHGLVFNAGEHVYGCTSPLWAVLIADLMAFGVDGLLAARILGWIATLASVIAFMQLCRRMLARPATRACATLAWSTHAWLLRWSLSGMETSLATALVLAGFVAFPEGERWGARPGRTGALWSLAALARPEAAFLLFLWGLFLILDAQERESVARLFWGALPPLFIYGTWLLFARFYFGTFWPQTLAAKSAGAEGLEFLGDNVKRQMLIVGATDGVLVAGLVLAALFGGRRLMGVRRSWTEELLPLAWVVCLPPLYAARGVQVISRYLVPLLPILALTAWRALEAWWWPASTATAPTRRSGPRLALAAVAVLVAAQNLAVYRGAVLPQVQTFTAAVKECLQPWGQWFRRHTAPGTIVAPPDIGAIGYYSDRPILDLAGLITPGMVNVLEHETPERAVSEFRFAEIARPEFLVDRAPQPYRLQHQSPYASALIPLGVSRVANLGLARPEPAYYSVYRIDWAAYDRLTAPPPPPTR